MEGEDTVLQKYFHHDFTNSPAAPAYGQVLKSIGDACPTHQNCCNIIYNCSNLYNCHPIAYSSRCLGQENPCEGISLGSCLVEEESILNTYSARPDKCSKLCDMNNNCEFWKARWDGTLCHLLISDYRHVSLISVFCPGCQCIHTGQPGLWFVCWTDQLGRLH